MTSATHPERHGLRSGIAWRVFAGTAVIVGVVVMVALFMASAAARRSADATARRSLEQAADLVAQLLAGRERSLAGGARVFVQGPYFRTLVAERRRDDILDQTFEAAEQLEAAWVFITDDAGTLLAKSDEPSAAGDALGGVALISNALRGQVSGGFGASGDSLLFQVTSVPIAIPGRTPLGVLVATRTIDSTLLADIRTATASDVVFYASDREGAPHLVASTLPVTPGLRGGVHALLAPKPASGDPFRAPRQDASFDGVAWIAQSAALTTAGGDVVGGFVVLRPRDEALATLVGVRRSLISAGILGFLLALLAAWAAARSVTRPVRALALAVRRAADGDYGASASADMTDRDSGTEIGALARAFDALLIDLRDKDSLSATTAAAVALEEARRDDEAVEPRSARRDGTRPRGGRSGGARPLAIGGAAVRGAPATTLERGHVVSHRYIVDSVLGRGSSGVVYRARDRVLAETVAIKMLRPELNALESRVQDQLREELRRIRRVGQRNVVRMYDLGDDAGAPFVTMEYIESASLDTVIRVRGVLPVPAVLSLARQLMRALAAARAEGLVHGDIKPRNLLIGPNGVLKVTDFAIARVLRAAHRQAPAQEGSSAVAGHLGGAAFGTPEYLAPELLIGGAPSVPGDLYAAGVVLHECLVGRTPHEADSPTEFLSNKFADPPRTSRVADGAAVPLPQVLESLLTQLVHPDPERRPGHPERVLEMLARIG